MTAINVFTFQHKAIVFTDGLTHEQDTKRRKCSTNKALPVAHLDAVIACSGVALLSDYMHQMAQMNFYCFDQAIDGWGALLRNARAEMIKQYPTIPLTGRAHLVGYSERHSSFLDCMASYGSEDAEDFAPQLLASFQGPCPSLCDAETQAATARLLASDGDGMEADGVTLMRGQSRSDPATLGDFCQMTIIDRLGISTRILERWA